jgi:hypothetical protein
MSPQLRFFFASTVFVVVGALSVAVPNTARASEGMYASICEDAYHNQCGCLSKAAATACASHCGKGNVGSLCAWDTFGHYGMVCFCVEPT